MIYEEVLKAEEKLNQCINWETGEISDEYDNAKEELQSVLEEGIETLCKIRANKLAKIESLKSEINRLSEKKKIEEKRIESLEKYISQLFDKTEKPKLDAGTFMISYRKSKQVWVEDDFEVIPENKDYLRYKIDIDKTKIKEALQSGIEVKGASLIEKNNLQIK